MVTGSVQIFTHPAPRTTKTKQAWERGAYPIRYLWLVQPEIPALLSKQMGQKDDRHDLSREDSFLPPALLSHTLGQPLSFCPHCFVIQVMENYRVRRDRKAEL